MRAAQIALAFLGISLGLAGVHASVGHLHPEIVSITAAVAANRSHWFTARDKAMRALSMKPHEYRYLEQTAVAEEKLGRVLHAEQLWRRALIERPNWPYPWARLARLQLNAKVPPDALEASVSAISRYGPHERGLQRVFAALALQPYQPPLAAPVQAFLDLQLLGEIREQRRNILGYALVRRRERILCARLHELGIEEWACEAVQYMRRNCDRAVPLPPDADLWCRNMARLWESFDYPARTKP